MDIENTINVISFSYRLIKKIFIKLNRSFHIVYTYV